MKMAAAAWRHHKGGRIISTGMGRRRVGVRRRHVGVRRRRVGCGRRRRVHGRGPLASALASLLPF